MESQLISQPPTEFAVFDRVYELVPFLKERESSIAGKVMTERARELRANLGEEDGWFVMEHQDKIPSEFQMKFFPVFTNWQSPPNELSVAILYWHDGNGARWCQSWGLLNSFWGENFRLVRRVK